jgi:hypothetical protein
MWHIDAALVLLGLGLGMTMQVLVLSALNICATGATCMCSPFLSGVLAQPDKDKVISAEIKRNEGKAVL